MSERLSPEQLRAWLDRRPPREPHNGVARPWRVEWFDSDGAYLGNRSGAVPVLDGPGSDGDATQAAKAGSESTKDTDGGGR